MIDPPSGEEWYGIEELRSIAHEFSMKDIASRRLFPKINPSAGSSTSEQTTIGGEGKPHGWIAGRKKGTFP